MIEAQLVIFVVYQRRTRVMKRIQALEPNLDLSADSTGFDVLRLSSWRHMQRQVNREQRLIWARKSGRSVGDR